MSFFNCPYDLLIFTTWRRSADSWENNDIWRQEFAPRNSLCYFSRIRTQEIWWARHWHRHLKFPERSSGRGCHVDWWPTLVFLARKSTKKIEKCIPNKRVKNVRVGVGIIMLRRKCSAAICYQHTHDHPRSFHALFRSDSVYQTSLLLWLTNLIV